MCSARASLFSSSAGHWVECTASPAWEQLHTPSGTPTTPKLYRQRKPIPPEQTNAESFYYLKQMNNKTPMVVVLQDGEEIRGVIEWYDKNCLKLNRPDRPNLLLLKHNIKYLYKESEETPHSRGRED